MSPSKPVWSKRVGNESINELVVQFCAGRDVREKPMADTKLVPFDLETNAAHALMLGEQGILSEQETKGILTALEKIKKDFEAGQQIIDPSAEDVHMSIEQKITAMTTEGMGGRLHTGRSRNDQVATDMMLWLRREITELTSQCLTLLGTLVAHAKLHVDTPMPGMTHMQPAMITTWGHAVSGYAVRVQKIVEDLLSLLEKCSQCPLGSAASFGSSWPTNREQTAEHLGFQKPTPHTTDSIWSRGHLESQFGFVCSQLLNALSSMGQDLILYSTPPQPWIKLSHDVTTGSSIMPQKRNPDFAEVTRAKAGVVSGMVQSLLSLGIASPNGYNRDTQYSKYLVMDVADEIDQAALVFSHVFATMTVDTAAMKKATELGFLNATDVADFLAQKRSLPFRLCYQVLGKAVLACEAEGKLSAEAVNEALKEVSPNTQPLFDEEMAQLNDPDYLLSLRPQTGSPNPEKTQELLLDLETGIGNLAEKLEQKQNSISQSSEKLWKLVNQKTNS